MAMLEYARFGIALLLFTLLVIALSYVTPLLPPKFRFYINASLSHLLLLIAVVYGQALSLGERTLGRNGVSMWSCCRFFAWMMTRATGIKVVIEDMEYLNARPAVLIMNHQT